MRFFWAKSKQISSFKFLFRINFELSVVCWHKRRARSSKFVLQPGTIIFCVNLSTSAVWQKRVILIIQKYLFCENVLKLWWKQKVFSFWENNKKIFHSCRVVGALSVLWMADGWVMKWKHHFPTKVELKLCLTLIKFDWNEIDGLQMNHHEINYHQQK